MVSINRLKHALVASDTGFVCFVGLLLLEKTGTP
jgi:hypothetical protein